MSARSSRVEEGARVALALPPMALPSRKNAVTLRMDLSSFHDPSIVCVCSMAIAETICCLDAVFGSSGLPRMNRGSLT